MIFFIALLILLSCYVSSAEMTDECKTTYFAVVGILSILIVVFNLIF